MKKKISYHKVYIFFSLLINVMIKSFELFSQVSDVAHGPLVFKINSSL